MKKAIFTADIGVGHCWVVTDTYTLKQHWYLSIYETTG